MYLYFVLCYRLMYRLLVVYCPQLFCHIMYLFIDIMKTLAFQRHFDIRKYKKKNFKLSLTNTVLEEHLSCSKNTLRPKLNTCCKLKFFGYFPSHDV